MLGGPKHITPLPVAKSRWFPPSNFRLLAANALSAVRDRALPQRSTAGSSTAFARGRHRPALSTVGSAQPWAVGAHS